MMMMMMVMMIEGMMMMEVGGGPYAPHGVKRPNTKTIIAQNAYCSRDIYFQFY